MSCCIYDMEKDMYVSIAKKLAGNETIEFSNLSNFGGMCYYLKEGCKALGIPPKTWFGFTFRLIYNSQSRVKDALEKREDIDKGYLVYCEMNKGLRQPTRNMGKLETIPHYEFVDWMKRNPKAKTSEEKIIDAIITSIEEDSSVYEQSVSPQEMLDWLKEQKALLREVKSNK